MPVLNHLPVLSASWILSALSRRGISRKAVASNYLWLDEIMSRDVVTTNPNEPIETAARKMEEHQISALPVIDEQQHVTGIITVDAISGTCVGEGKPVRILSIHATPSRYDATKKTKMADPPTGYPRGHDGGARCPLSAVWRNWMRRNPRICHSER